MRMEEKIENATMQAMIAIRRPKLKNSLVRMDTLFIISLLSLKFVMPLFIFIIVNTDNHY